MMENNISGYTNLTNTKSKHISVFFPSRTMSADQQIYTNRILSLDDVYDLICNTPNTLIKKNIRRENLKNRTFYMIFNPLFQRPIYTKTGYNAACPQEIRNEEEKKRIKKSSYHIYDREMTKLKYEFLNDPSIPFPKRRIEFEILNDLFQLKKDNYGLISDYCIKEQEIRIKYHPKYAVKILNQNYISRSSKDHHKYNYPRYLQLDLDLKGSKIDEFIDGWNNEKTFQECKDEFVSYLKTLPDVVFIGTSSGGEGLRVIVSYTTIIHDYDDENYDDRLPKHIHKMFSELWIDNFIRNKFKNTTSWIDPVYNKWGQGTYPFGIKMDYSIDLYYNRTFKSSIFNYYLNCDLVKERNLSKTYINMDRTYLNQLKESLTTQSIFGVHSQIDIKKKLNNWIDERLNQYNIGVHNVICGMLAAIDDTELYELFRINIYRVYKKSHDSNNPGGLYSYYSNKNKFITYCKNCLRRSLDEGFSPLHLNSFLFGEKYLNINKMEL